MPLPSPRLCHIAKWKNCPGYGFHLTSQRNKPGQFISSVDPESAAEAAGLKVGDRIVEVNGANVGLENHKQVVARIKAVDDNTNLLVLDKDCDDCHRLHDIVVKSNLAHVVIRHIKDQCNIAVGQKEKKPGLDLNMNMLTATTYENHKNTYKIKVCSGLKSPRFTTSF